MKIIFQVVYLSALIFVSNNIHAALIDRGGGLIYDNILDVTWLQDANYSITSGYSSNGQLDWFAATEWVSNLGHYDSVRG